MIVVISSFCLVNYLNTVDCGMYIMYIVHSTDCFIMQHATVVVLHVVVLYPIPRSQVDI